MKTQIIEPTADQPTPKPVGQFASGVEFLAAKQRRFQEVFGKVDWEKARREGLIR